MSGDIIKEKIIELGFKLFKDRLDKAKLQQTLKKYIEEERKTNEISDLSNEIDFGGLVDYISENLYCDFETRIFGNSLERNTARKTIRNKTTYYANSNNQAGSTEKILKITENICVILKDFYTKKIPKELKLLKNEIIDETSQILRNETSETHCKLDKILENQKKDKQIYELINKGNFDKASRLQKIELNKFKGLHPIEGFEVEFNSRVGGFVSVAKTPEVASKYPVKYVVSGNVIFNKKPVYQFDETLLNYSYNLQQPITIDILEATKYLGDYEAPDQIEATQMAGQKILINPEPFPIPKPCSVIIDGEVVLDYLLLGLVKIDEDNICYIDNNNQTTCDYLFQIKYHKLTGNTNFNIINKEKTLNKSKEINIFNTIKKFYLGNNISIKILETSDILLSSQINQEKLAEKIKDLNEQIELREKIIALEKYLEKEVTPTQLISQNDYDFIDTVYSLINGETFEKEIESAKFSIEINETNQVSVMNHDNCAINVCYVAIYTYDLFNQKCQIKIRRELHNVKIKDFDKLKRKLQLADIGETLNFTLISADSKNDIHVTDKLFNSDLDKDLIENA